MSKVMDYKKEYKLVYKACKFKPCDPNICGAVKECIERWIEFNNLSSHLQVITTYVNWYVIAIIDKESKYNPTIINCLDPMECRHHSGIEIDSDGIGKILMNGIERRLNRWTYSSSYVLKLHVIKALIENKEKKE